MSWVLGIETSCDETCVSVLDTVTRRFVFEHTQTQVHSHAPYGGVVPNLASRLHLDHLGDMVTKLDQTLPGWQERIAMVGASTRPGLVTSLLVGAVFGRSVAQFCGVPFVPVDHCEAHLYSSILPDSANDSVLLDTEPLVSEFPLCALIVSGGHTYWILVSTLFDYRCLGATRDDAMGECFDKVAKMLGLAYPGGPEIERRSHLGSAERFVLPVPMPDGHDFSFSGLKTAVRKCISETRDMTPHVDDVCAAFHAVIDRLVAIKVTRCIEDFRPKAIWLSGGVSANMRIRNVVRTVCAQKGVVCRIVPRKYAQDNASMIAYLAYLKYKSRACDTNQAQVLPYSIFS